jgi:hypothetical protein
MLRPTSLKCALTCVSKFQHRVRVLPREDIDLAEPAADIHRIDFIAHSTSHRDLSFPFGMPRISPQP